MDPNNDKVLELQYEIDRLRAEVADLKDCQLPARVNAATASLRVEVADLTAKLALCEMGHEARRLGLD